MTDTAELIRAHYDGRALVDLLKAALPEPGRETEPLTVGQLAPLDQFHTRGIQATAELAESIGLRPDHSVLDVGCGIGGPARYLAATLGCKVTGVDLSQSFVDAAEYLTLRCGLSDRVIFQQGDALDLPFNDGSFDRVLLQHVAMNVSDRDGLYREVARVLKPGGGFATYDVVMTDKDVIYPLPWARDATTSFLLDAASTRRAVEAARSNSRPAGPGLAVVMGPDFPVLASNLGRNLKEGRLGILFAVFTRE